MNTNPPRLSDNARKQLSSARDRRILLRLCNGFLAILALLLIFSGLAMLIDWFVAARSTTLRILLSLSACGGFLVLGAWAWRKLPFQAGLRHTAKWLDEMNPALQERLSTMVELDGTGSHSSELLGAVGEQIDHIGVRDNPRRAIFTRPFIFSVAAIISALCLLGILKTISGKEFSTLVDRLVHPWSNQTLTNLPGKTDTQYHLRGKPFEAAVPISGKIPRNAILEYRSTDGSLEQREITINRESGSVRISIPRVEKDFRYRLLAGDDETPWNEVTVLDRPRLEDVKLLVTPPAYTNVEEREWTSLPRRIEVPEGSEVSLTFTSDQKLPSATIVQRGNQKERVTELVPEEDGRFRFETKPSDSVQAEIQLISLIGDLQSRFSVTLAVKRDKKPQVKLLEGTETFAMKADETLNVAFQAIDDYGIESAELVAEITKPDGTKQEFRFPIELGSKAEKTNFKASATLDLKKIPLQKGDDLRYAVEVSDHRGLEARNPAKGSPEQPIASAQAGGPSVPSLQSAKEENARAMEQAQQMAQNAKQQEQVEKRKLDLAQKEKQPSKSKSAQVTVDEFAKYLIAGDGQKIQQIAIQAVLDLILKSAQESRKQIAEIGPAPDATAPRPEHDSYANAIKVTAPKISASLRKGAEGAEELRKVSEGTPYSFFGLQAKAMIETGFSPAYDAIIAGVESDDTADRSKQLSLADERLRWVISLLEKNKKQFDKMIEYEEVLELAHKFKKMHEITIEDMPSLGGGECRTGPYAKLKKELGDEQIQALIANLKLKREVLKRLSELLQENPELRARMLGKSNASGKIYREELSLLRNRQKNLTEALALLVNADPAAAPAEFNSLIRKRLLTFSTQTTEALGLSRVWIPTKTPAGQRKKLEDAIAQLSQAVDALASANPKEKEIFEKAVKTVRKTGKETIAILSEPAWSETFADYTQFRTHDLKDMSTELDTCVALVMSLHKNNGHEFVAQLQGELNDETRLIAVSMMNSLSSISGVSEKADSLIEELDKLLAETLLPAQKRALHSIPKKDDEVSIVAMKGATAALEDATRLLDSAITEFIRAKSEQDALAEQIAGGEATPLPDPTEEQIAAALARLLKTLEKQSRESTDPTLGISLQTNVQLKTDWEKDEKSESEKQALARKIQEQKKQAQMAATAAAQAQQIANSKAREIAHQMSQRPSVPWKQQDLLDFENRNDWNTIPSQLKESLTQDFGATMPEEYRTAIEEYFRTIAEVNKP